MEDEQKEDEQDQEPKAKPITFYFYNCSREEGNKLMEGLTPYNGVEVLTHKRIERARVQMESPKIEGNLVYGIMRRLRRNIRTKVGSVKQSKSYPVLIKRGQFFIEETYFLYDNSRQVLLYQQNQIGVPCRIFYLYVNQITRGSVAFGPLLTKDAYKMLTSNKMKLHKLKIMKFALPTNAGLFRDPRDKWDKEVIEMATAMGGGSIEIILSARIKGGGKYERFLNQSAVDFALRLVGNINRDEEGGEATFYDIENRCPEVVDLVAGRFKTVVPSDVIEGITQEGQIDSSDIFRIMKERMKKAQPKLDQILARDD